MRHTYTAFKQVQLISAAVPNVCRCLPMSSNVSNTPNTYNAKLVAGVGNGKLVSSSHCVSTTTEASLWFPVSSVLPEKSDKCSLTALSDQN